MIKIFASIYWMLLLGLACQAQKANSFIGEMRLAGSGFLQTLTPEQQQKAQFSFDDEERYHWNFVPMSRKGIPMGALSGQQRTAALALLRTALSDTGYAKATAIITLETVLKKVENRSDEDHYRDPNNYYVSIFGNPQHDSVWGWRFEGHHVAFNFTSDEKGLVSGTPGFLGANPAVVQSGEQKGKEVLHEETAWGFALLHSLTAEQKKTALINAAAPGEIITGSSRKAMLEAKTGISYSELTAPQQQLLVQLLTLYIHRYKKPFAQTMMKEIETAGYANLRFAWAGADQPGIGHPHYYRLQGPTVLIEYDNTQNNANHVHTVVRDLNHDFGGDQLLEHYQHQIHRQ